MPLQIRRGTEAQRELMAQPLAPGELLYVTDDRRLFVGDGVTLGGVQITGYTDENAQDAAAALFTSGSHNGISFSYNDSANRVDATVNLSNYTGVIKADAFKGSLFADDGSSTSAQPLVDAISGTFNGNLSGTILTAAQPNITSLGTLSSLTVTGTVSAATLSGTNVSGTSITGNIFTSLIDSADSTAITVTPNVLFSADVIVDNDFVASNIVLNGVSHTSIGRELFPTPQDNEPADHYPSFVDALSGRSIVKTDGNLRYNPFTKVLTANTFTGGTVNAPSINSTNILTANVNSNGVLLLYSNLTTTGNARVVSVGGESVDGRFQVATSSYLGGLNLVNINQSHNTADSLNFQFNRSRGTIGSQTAVQNGDDIVDITFAGWDGSAPLARAAITATVNGAVSTGVIPMKIAISTSVNGSGNPVTAIEVNEKQETTFTGAITLAVYADAAARNTAIPTPTAGMMVYISSTGKFQGYNGLTSTWNDLN